MKKHPSLIIAAFGLMVLGVFLVAVRHTHNLQVKTYLQDAQGLGRGARVHMAGVDVGMVNNIQVRPELHAAEITMDLRTPYELTVPSDAIALVDTAGVLGEPFVQINIQNTSGPPLKNGGVIKSIAPPRIDPQRLMECFSNVAQHKACDANGTNRGDPKAAQSR